MKLSQELETWIKNTCPHDRKKVIENLSKHNNDFKKVCHKCGSDEIHGVDNSYFCKCGYEWKGKPVQKS